MLRNIFLYGKLKEEFGPVWNLDVESVAEAAHAINMNTDGKFGQVIRDMFVEVVRGDELESGEKIDKSLATFNYSRGDFHISPVAMGAGGKAFKWGVAGFLTEYLIWGLFSSFFKTPEDNLESDKAGYTFTSTKSNDIQGGPIPLIYGEVYTGSIAISQGIKIEEVAD